MSIIFFKLHFEKLVEEFNILRVVFGMCCTLVQVTVTVGHLGAEGRSVDLVLTAVTPHWSGLERDAQCGRPDDGLRFSQYSLRALVEKQKITVNVPLSLRLK